MTQLGRFDTDATALKQRIAAHEKYAAADLNQWIFNHLELAHGLALLELGCGTGKQAIPLAQAVGPAGTVWAVDISAQALQALAENARNQGLDRRITPLCCSLDALTVPLRGRTFDRALSSYALYYAARPAEVFRVVRETLKPGGVFFFCGPAADNNAELKHFHYGLRRQPPPQRTDASAFMEEHGPRLARQFFESVEVLVFENPLRFDSAEGLINYWRSYNLYDETLEADFCAAAARHFQADGVFETIKRVVGVRATAAARGARA